jgi:citrate synthase
MYHGKRQSQLAEKAMDVYLVCLAEHSMNASTFAARVTISTISDIYSAVSSALGALKGDAHGGANMRAMEMLLDIGTDDNVENYVEESFRIKRRLMGMGHRIYKTRDPRVDQLMRYSEALAEETGDPTWHNMAHKLEEITATHQFFLERKLFPNVEFYSAPVLHMLGLTTDTMPGAFAISRISGWTAQVLEQLEDNRLIRPAAIYTGPESQTYVPIDQRA